MLSWLKYFGKRKELAEILAEQKLSPLKRHLGPWGLIGMGIGAIVGAGVFVITGSVAANHAGPAIVLSFLIASLACGLAGLCYAELASAIPIAGSAYTYAYATLGQGFAWLLGWDLILEYLLGASAVSIGWSAYLKSLCLSLGLRLPAEWCAPWGAKLIGENGGELIGLFNVPAFGGVLVLSALLLSGVRLSARFTNAMVFLKLGVIALFLIVALPGIRPELLTPFIPAATGMDGQFGWSGVLRGASILFFAFLGFDQVATAAQEAKDPQRNMPIGILGSLGLSAFVFVLTALALVGTVHYRELNIPDPFALAADRLGMPWLGLVIKCGAFAGLSSVLFMQLYSLSRILYAMARDGLLPSAFSFINPLSAVPSFSLKFQALIIALMAGLFPVDLLGELISVGTLFAFATISLGALYLRYRLPHIEAQFRMPLMPWIPLASIAMCIFLSISLPLVAWLRLLAWMGVGLAYLLVTKYKAQLNAR